MTHIAHDPPISTDGILEVKQRLAGKIYKTGVPRSNYFSEHYQGKIFLEFGNMQYTDLFKICGTFNRLYGLTAAERRRGVVAYSAGNHTQGVSPSCTMLGIDGEMVMLKGTPEPKAATIYSYPAEVVLRGDDFNDTPAKTSDIVEPEGRIFIPPHDDPQVIAGWGAIGLGTLEDLHDVGNIIMPIGGSGLIAGIAIAIKSINLTVRIIGAQSENVRGMAVSWYAGEIAGYRYAGTLADGCDVAWSGKLTREVIHQLVDDIVLVSEDDICQSIVALIQRNKVITEGAGALTCVALLSGKLGSYIQNRKTVSLISGGNIDLLWVSQTTGFVDA